MSHVPLYCPSCDDHVNHGFWMSKKENVMATPIFCPTCQGDTKILYSRDNHGCWIVFGTVCTKFHTRKLPKLDPFETRQRELCGIPARASRSRSQTPQIALVVEEDSQF